MVNRTHYYGVIHDVYMRGRINPSPTDIMDPVLGMRVQLAAPPSVALAVNVVMRGNTSGAAGLIRRVIDTTTAIVEMLPNAIAAPPLDLPGLAFAQNNAGPFTGETITLDNGGTGTISVLGNAQSISGQFQFLYNTKDSDYSQPIPSDFSDSPYWDAHAKVAQQLVVGTLTGTSPYFRKGDRCTTATGAFTVLKVTGSGASRTLYIVRKTGTLSAAQTITNTTLGGGTTANLTTIVADEPTGIWVPWSPLPNLAGLADSFEFPPNGNATDGKDPSLGIEARMLPLMHAYHQQAAAAPGDRGWRFLPFSSNDPPEGYPDGATGGVVVQIVRGTGTFPASGTLVIGETVTGPGGWAAVVHGFDIPSKSLFVRKTNGIVLGAGTLTLSGGATVTTNGPVLGWQKGSSHWNAWAATVTTALSRGASTGSAGALVGGAAAYWEGIILAPWQTELLVHGGAAPAPFPTTPQAMEAWVQWVADIRTFLGRADLPVTVWSHLPNSFAGISFFGIPWAYVQREFMRALPGSIERLTVTDSYALGCKIANDSDFYLRTLDQPEILSAAFWRHLRFGQVLVVPGDGFTPLPVGIHLGQSNATGSTPASAAIAFDADPDLWPLGAFTGTLSTIDPNCLSFNQVTELLEPFAVDVNANGSWGTPQGTSGPEVPVWQRMKMRFSDSATASAKFCGFKFTVPGSCVNKLVDVGSGTWDPTLSARPAITANMTVSLIAASGSLPARARFTATAGTFAESIWRPQQSVKISGSALGVQLAGGNNSPPWTVQLVYAIATDGSWLEVYGSVFVVETANFTLLAGPPPIWPVLVDKWNKFVVQCREHGYVPVPRYIVWDQGEGDTPRIAEYEEALDRFWRALVALVGLRLKGDEPIPKCVVQTTSQTGWAASDEDIALLRELQVSVPTALGNVVVVDPSDLSLTLGPGEAWPRQSRLDNGLHLTGRAQITKGFRIDKALATLGPSKGIPEHPKGELAVDADGAVNGGTGEGAPSDSGSEDAAGGGSSAAAGAAATAIEDAIANNPAIASYTVSKESRTVNMRTLKDLREELDKQRAEEARQSGFGDTLVDFNP